MQMQGCDATYLMRFDYKGSVPTLITRAFAQRNALQVRDHAVRITQVTPHVMCMHSVKVQLRFESTLLVAVLRLSPRSLHLCHRWQVATAAAVLERWFAPGGRYGPAVLEALKRKPDDIDALHRLSKAASGGGGDK
jgi:hypothetical protein